MVLCFKNPRCFNCVVKKDAFSPTSGRTETAHWCSLTEGRFCLTPEDAITVRVSKRISTLTFRIKDASNGFVRQTRSFLQRIDWTASDQLWFQITFKTTLL